ncbi:MAG: hypothetical protein AB1422_19470 [bacterium]
MIIFIEEENMHKKFILGFICGIIVGVLPLGIKFWLHKEAEQPSFTHLQISKEPLKKGIVEIFYPEENATQKKLAHQILEILVKEYEMIEKVLEIPQENLLSYQPYGLVFCEDIDDIFLKYTNKGLVLVDGILCYPVVAETIFPFRESKTRLRLVYTLPKELVKGIIKEKLKLKEDGVWFAEGIGGYIGFLCWQRFDRYAFFNYEYPRILKLYANKKPGQETIDLTDYQISKELEYFYTPASTFIIIDLVNRHGRGIVAKIISKLTTSNNKIGSKEIAQTIKELTGDDILSGLKVVSLEKVEERFKSLKLKLL